MRNKVIIVSDGYTTDLFVNGKVYENNIVAVKYEHQVGVMNGPKLEVMADTLPVHGEENTNDFKKKIDFVLSKKDNTTK